eukprot:jgi/Galph1/2247/GphlegSOOS_G939.1
MIKDSSRTTTTAQKIAVIGGGISGITTAWCLSKHGYDVTIFEKESELGGHAKVIYLEHRGKKIPVDVGFMVFNEKTYPNLVTICNYLAQPKEATNMSFSFSQHNNFCWSSDSLNTLFAQRSNLWNVSFYRLLYDMYRFNREASAWIESRNAQSRREECETIGDFLKRGKYSTSFCDGYLLPMSAAVWSCSQKDILSFPISFFLQFFYNHGFLQVLNRPQWYHLKGTSHALIAKIMTQFHGTIRCNSKIIQVTRQKHNKDKTKIEITVENQSPEIFDQVVFATHAPTTIDLLREEWNDKENSEEYNILKHLLYGQNEIYIHWDETWMPLDRKTWSSWNFLSQEKKQSHTLPCVTYWLNQLQNLPHDMPPIFETLNPWSPPDPNKTIAHFTWEHPQYTIQSYISQKRLQEEIQGKNNTWYCGAYCGYGFHEDGIVSGIQVASRLVGKEFCYFWEICHAQEKNDEIERVRKEEETGHWMMDILGQWCQSIVLDWMKQFIQEGIILLMNSSSSIFCRVGQSSIEYEKQVTIKVFRPRFYFRILFYMDIGFAESYMFGDIQLSNDEALLDLFDILIKNRDKKRLYSWKYNLFNWTGGWWNSLQLHWFRRNSLQNSRHNIRQHYDLSNDLFALFLGPTWLYSCALWLSADYTLEDAQMAKMDRIISYLSVEETDHVLEIGFGWGELAIQLVKKTKCRVTGITLSEEQCKLARERVKLAGLSDHITLQVIDYRLLKGQFDRIVSIEMIEAVGHEYLGQYFAALERLLKPNGWIVLQMISVPEYRYEEYRQSSDFINKYIFPGSCCPSLTAVCQAMSQHSSLMITKVEEIGGLHYGKTLAAWRQRWISNQDKVRQLGFDSIFFRKWIYYFCYCEIGFVTRTLADYQVIITRPGTRWNQINTLE